ncbi:MAG: type I restriction enzyme HsdR N-terminal domain-containing protein [Desulfonatronovibrio sp.]
MHEVSLNQVITDYLTGKEIELTTYEDLRQALARIMVEEKGYPKEAIVSKYPIALDVGDEKYFITVDFIVYYNGQPVMVLGFCPGAVSTFITQYVSLARILPEGPAPYVLITDSKDAALVRTMDKKELCRGYHCIPTWEKLIELFQHAGDISFSADRIKKEQRVAYAMFALSDSCCTSECPTR